MTETPLLQKIFQKFILFLNKRYAFFRFIFFITSDFLITFVSFILSIFIFTRIVSIPYSWWIIVSIILLAFLIKILFFTVFKIYNISFQYASALYILKIFSIILISAILNYFVIKAIFPAYWFLIISILEFLFDIIGSVSFRFLPLVYHELCNMIGEENQNGLIYGCGQTGKGLLPILMKTKIKIKGFIDDSPHNLNKVISGVRVLGKIGDLEKIVNKIKIDTLIIATPSLTGEKTKHIKQICSKLNVSLKTVPSFIEIYNKGIESISSSIRNINYDDLIKRPVKKEDFSDLKNFLEAKKLIVAGVGSIGSELINQLTKFQLKEIVAIDNSELNLFNLEDIIGRESFKKVKTRLIDLKNKKTVIEIFSNFKPDIVFHTAAYKHVPIIEENACEGALNNLLSLKNVYEASRDYEAKKFIFISSDKAVRPTNIMGATKRLGELYLQAMNAKDKMVSCSVRFGNVVGSSGSLVPKIIKQMQNNRAVTITHPEARRFFMLVSEAVLLILKASILSNGGEIFILDMGKPIKIDDIVKDIINFYGKNPGVDVSIEYTGLRPGEKLFEELFLDEVEQKYYKDGMYIAKPNSFEYNEFIKSYDEILLFSQNANKNDMTNLIKKYVEIYTNEQLLQKRENSE